MSKDTENSTDEVVDVSRDEVRDGDVSCRSSDMSCRSSDVSCRVEDVSCRVEDVNCRSSDVSCRVEDESCRIEDVNCRSSDVSCRVGDVNCRSSDVSCRVGDESCRVEDESCRVEDVSCRPEDESCNRVENVTRSRVSSTEEIVHSVIQPDCDYCEDDDSEDEDEDDSEDDDSEDEDDSEEEGDDDSEEDIEHMYVISIDDTPLFYTENELSARNHILELASKYKHRNVGGLYRTSRIEEVEFNVIKIYCRFNFAITSYDSIQHVLRYDRVDKLCWIIK